MLKTIAVFAAAIFRCFSPEASGPQAAAIPVAAMTVEVLCCVFGRVLRYKSGLAGWFALLRCPTVNVCFL